MKADTIFRFVSVRPPERNKEKSPTTLKNDKATLSIKTYIAHAQSSGTTPEKLAESVADKIKASPDYFMNNAEMKPLLDQSDKFRTIVRNSILKSDPNFFKSQVADALQPIFGQSIDLVTIAQSERFDNAKASIWLSYYASVLSAKPLVGSRGEIHDWIRFFGLVEAAADDELLARRLRLYQHMRPSLPDLLFPLLSKRNKNNRVVHEEKSGKSSDKVNVPRVIKVLEEHINKQKNARTELEELFREKLIHARKTTKQRRLADRVIDTKQQEIEQTATREQIVPWILEEKDLTGRNNLSDMMHDLRFNLDSSSIPHLIQKLDRLIATSKSRLYELQSEEVIIPYGKCFVRVKRKKKFGD